MNNLGDGNDFAATEFMHPVSRAEEVETARIGTIVQLASDQLPQDGRDNEHHQEGDSKLDEGSLLHLHDVNAEGHFRELASRNLAPRVLPILFLRDS